MWFCFGTLVLCMPLFVTQVAWLSNPSHTSISTWCDFPAILIPCFNIFCTATLSLIFNTIDECLIAPLSNSSPIALTDFIHHTGPGIMIPEFSAWISSFSWPKLPRQIVLHVLFCLLLFIGLLSTF
jgi:hypothetical protein